MGGPHSVFPVAQFGKLYKRILDTLRRSPQVAYVLFGVRVRQRIIPFTWDVTTLVLKKAIDQHVPSGECTVLDMGCGHLAILGQYVKRTHPRSRVISADLYREFALNAGLNARLNGSDIEVRHGDLFGPIVERFDYIMFNPPYVPMRENAMKFPLTTFAGSDGTETFERFLQEAPEHLNDGGRILLGINCFHVPAEKVREIVNSHRFQVTETVERRFNTAKVFVLAKYR